MEKSINFCIDIKYVKGSGDPTRVFRSMTGLIEAFKSIDSHLIGSIHPGIKPEIILEEIEIGSVRTWFKYVLEQVNDDALNNLDWKPLVGQYLVKGKYILLNFIEKREKIETYSEIDELEKKLLAEATATDVRRIPYYRPVSKRQLLEDMVIINEAISPLSDLDEASYISSNNKAMFNQDFAMTHDSIEALLTKERITNREVLILKVKKPDYLGESKWEFHSGRIIPAKIEDFGWLMKFRARNPEAHVLPGDSLKVRVDHSINYGFEGEIISEDYVIVEVIGVQHPPTQSDLF